MTHKFQIKDNFIETNFAHCIAFLFFIKNLKTFAVWNFQKSQKVMKPDNKLQLNCHNEAAQNAKENSKSFT